MAIGVDRVQLRKSERTALGGDDADIGEMGEPTPIAPQEDAIEVAGVYFQDETDQDENVAIYRDNGKAYVKDVAHPDGIVLARSTKGHRSGLLITVSANARVDVGVGLARDSTDVMDLELTSADSALITSSGAGGLDTGSEAADTWYAIHIIGDTSGVNSEDLLLSLSSTAPTMPSGYDVFRHIGWTRNSSSSHFHRYREVREGWVQYDISRNTGRVLNGGTATIYTDVDTSDLVPVDSSLALCNINLNTSVDSSYIRFRGGDFDTTSIVNQHRPGLATGSSRQQGTVFIPLDSSQVFEYECSTADISADVYVAGYVSTL